MKQSKLEVQRAAEPGLRCVLRAVQAGLGAKLVVHAGDAEFVMGIAQRFHPVEATLFTGDARRPQVEKQFCPLPDFLFFGANLAQTLFDLIFSMRGA